MRKQDTQASYSHALLAFLAFIDKEGVKNNLSQRNKDLAQGRQAKHA
jgi:hypothetical protein